MGNMTRLKNCYFSVKNHYFLLRHGQTNYLDMDLCYPWPDSSKAHLTKQGRADILKVAKILKKVKIDFIFSSDLFRTKETAKIIAKEIGLKIHYDQRLRDTRLGIYQNKPHHIFNRDFPLSKLLSRFSRLPGGESWNAVRQRVKKFLEDTEKKYQGKTILIIGHGDPFWLLEGVIKKLSNRELVNIILSRKYIKTSELRKIS